MKSPKDCKNIKDVRDAIDSIDGQIVSLLGKRLNYVKEVVKFKENTPESIIAKERRDYVLKSRREMAVNNGLDPNVVEEIYKILISHFIEKETQIINNKNIM